MLDLDALAAEANATPKLFKLGGKEFTLPAELPGDVLAPFLDPELGLIEVLADAIAGSDDDAQISELLFDALAKKPTLPGGLVAAAGEALKRLIGDEQYPAFLETRPSVQAYTRLAKGLAAEYNLSMSDFFGSSSPSESGGESSSPTSPTTTPEPTSEASSVIPQEVATVAAPVIPAPPASSESAD